MARSRRRGGAGRNGRIGADNFTAAGGIIRIFARRGRLSGAQVGRDIGALAIGKRVADRAAGRLLLPAAIGGGRRQRERKDVHEVPAPVRHFRNPSIFVNA